MKIKEFIKENSHRLRFAIGEHETFTDACIMLHHDQEQKEMAQRLESEGYTVVSVHETDDEEGFVDLTIPCDFGTQPFKYGYFALINNLK